MKTHIIAVAAALSVGVTLAIAQEMDHGPAAMAGGGFAEANQKMMRDMTVASTGDIDKDFAMMIPHHQGAIDMARIELDLGKDPMLRDLAEKIIDAQETEIAFLKTWLQGHGM